MICIFVTTFINTAIFPVLNEASLDYSWMSGSIFQYLIRGKETDFSVRWYMSVGYTLTYSMAFTAVWPVLEFFMYYGLRLFNQLQDRQWTSSTFRTQQPSF